MNAIRRHRFLIARFFLLLAIFCACGLTLEAKSGRNDLVLMKNGDRLSGEVKGLQNGILYVKTDYVDDKIALDWRQVQGVESTAEYQITLVNGLRVTGKIKRFSKAPSADQEFLITSTSGNRYFPASAIAEISTQKDTFWRQLTGSVDAGYTFTSGNSQTTFNTDALATYTNPKWTASTALASSFNGQSDASKTNRIDGSLEVARFLSHNSYLGGLNDYLHSSQQDLNLRTTLGGGYGRYWIRTSTTTFRWLTGAVYTWESFSTVSGQPNDSNVEAFVGGAYDSYRFKFGEIHLGANLFPGLSDFGRVRLTTNNSLRIKLVNNFYFTMAFWDNFDSRPPSTAKKNELGISTSIGWSF
jgi:putative salt-induced outer membrane protein YdiY/sRNA-binding regulator protein Hfq